MKKVGLMEAYRWRDQTLAESKSWHMMTGSLTPENTEAYEAGYQAGYRDALSALKLHAGLIIDPDK